MVGLTGFNGSSVGTAARDAFAVSLPLGDARGGLNGALSAAAAMPRHELHPAVQLQAWWRHLLACGWPRGCQFDSELNSATAPLLLLLLFLLPCLLPWHGKRCCCRWANGRQKGGLAPTHWCVQLCWPWPFLRQGYAVSQTARQHHWYTAGGVVRVVREKHGAPLLLRRRRRR